MNSGEYLELTEGLKEIFERNDEIKNKHVNDYNQLYKNVCVVYGLIRTFQENDDDLSYHHLIEEIRTICSQALFKHLVDIED
tara:strand:+ start:1499 stop:1744 length:246 start_codon:yes stop_codon:yes gene_type:complete